AGVIGPGPVSEMAGSSTCLNAAVPRPLDVLEVTHYPNVVPGSFSTETGINTTGEAVRWLANLLYGGRRGTASGRDFARLDAEVSRGPPLAGGGLALPVPGDAAVTGVAMLAGIGAGVYRDAAEAIARCVRRDPPIQPDARLCQLYEGGYAAWRSLAESRAVRTTEAG